MTIFFKKKLMMTRKETRKIAHVYEGVVVVVVVESIVVAFVENLNAKFVQ